MTTIQLRARAFKPFKPSGPLRWLALCLLAGALLSCALLAALAHAAFPAVLLAAGGVWTGREAYLEGQDQ